MEIARRVGFKSLIPAAFAIMWPAARSGRRLGAADACNGTDPATCESDGPRRVT